MMQNMVRDFLDGSHFGIHQHIGLPVERFTRGEQSANSPGRIGIIQQGAISLMADAFPNHVGRSP
jgi:hypothetical protein